MCFGSEVVISGCPQCLHTGVPHPEHDVSVWMPQEQASSFRAGCIEIPLSFLVDVAGRYERDCYFYAKGEGRGNQGSEIKKPWKINKQIIYPSIVYP
jgi:hypothetical protein